MGQKCELGSQLRPHVVWFGEAVPMIEKAAEIASSADIFLIVGTSLAVYPAAGLIDFVPYSAEKIIIDPNTPQVKTSDIKIIRKKAGEGVPQIVEDLLKR